MAVPWCFVEAQLFYSSLNNRTAKALGTFVKEQPQDVLNSAVNTPQQETLLNCALTVELIQAKLLKYANALTFMVKMAKVEVIRRETKHKSTRIAQR